MAVPDLLDEREAVPENIGAALRGAREAAGYSIADVAERMRLSRHLVENLEAERFDLFPVSVFLRGYLTSYARLLGMDPEPLLEAYDRRGFGPPQLHSQDSARTSSRGSEFTVTITTLIVVAVLIILSALWWREQWTEDAGLPGVTVERPGEEGTAGAMDEGPGVPAGPAELAELAIPAGETAPEEPPGPEAATDDPAAEPPPVRAGAEPSAGDAAPGAAEPEGLAPPAREETEGPGETSTVPAEATEAPAEPLPAPDADAGEPADSAPAPDADADTGADAGADEPVETAPAPDTGTEESVEDTPGAGAEPAPATAEGTAPGPAASAPSAPGELATLLIRVNEDCWLMIRDADQRLVYRDLASAGTVLELSVAPPVRIVAGYAEGIELEYNGEPVDLSPWVEQDTGTARFRLGS